MTNTHLRKVLFAVISVIMLMGVLCTSVCAADQYQNFGLKYGEIVPTNAELSAQVKSYKFYGDSGSLYFMRISKGKTGARFAVEIYSDSQYKHQIRAYNNAYSKTAGNSPISIGWGFDTLKSGTYYGRCYSYTEGDDGKIIDATSLKTFTVKIDRLAKREVELVSTKNTEAGPKITWKKVPTAAQYRVYRKAAGEKEWTLLYKSGEKATSYTDKTAKSGKQYTYTVRCTDGKFTSLYNKTGLTIRYLSQPDLVSVNGTGSAGYAKLTWKKVTGAQGYYIYRKGGSLSNYKWENIATINSSKTTSYTDKKATSSDWNYTYTVKAYYGKYKSAHNATGVDFDYVIAPKITAITTETNGLKLKWSCDNLNVTKYYIYRKSADGWKKVGTATGKSFTDTTAHSGKTYTYTVKAATDTNNSAYSSSGKSAKFIGTPQLKSLTFDTKDRAVLKWSAVDGVANYRIYRKIDNAKSWTKIATVKASKTPTYYDSYAKKSGQKFTYTVRAVDSKDKTGGYIKSGISNIYLSIPVFTAIQQDNAEKTLAVEINWKKVAGAIYYKVYRRIPGGIWNVLADEYTELSFTDLTLESGVQYEYAVRAFGKDTSSKYTAKTLTAIAIPVISDVTIGDEGVTVNWSSVEGAVYNIYRAPFGTDEWELLGTADTPAFIDNIGDSKVTGYDYCVSAVVNNVESIKSSKMSNVAEITATATLTTVTIPVIDDETGEPVIDNETGEELTITKTSIQLAWDSPTAESVVVSKATGSDDSVDLGVFLTELHKNYNDENISAGNIYTYTFTSQAQGKINGTVTITVKYPLAPLEQVKVAEVSYNYNDGAPICTISWFCIDYASEYKILRSDNGKDYEEVGIVKAEDVVDGILSFTNNIDTETVYTYKIQAVSLEDREPSETDVPGEVCVYEPLSSLADLKAVGVISEDDIGNPVIHVTLTWAQTQYAEKYIVERKTVDGNYPPEPMAELLVDEDGNHPLTFTDETAEPGVTYIYRVTAKNADRGSSSNEIEYCWEIPAEQ